ncbi:bifunctional glutamate N-acetyltransferase/amino-acid acetyltransferase ArgJ [Kibdelosporangium phytohabitans]|uniref:Arginine biosynthesis bifunctional protein ArgJ n=1 Tax=Kibdelosporangium phytohabitans TaxID=860235 RepID=A0A0N9I0C6_9PSEU|nr:bifunctional glutamate N-acetyltransferase/amino-acid acetyltransferase ArgJ [Kibdelosporangium phytohabitans]ALG08110.1 N-acetylglutamate synthase [Kibdelosporangium phytohabitans]MBE1470914.1 glutamate N-acetyltransferase/amino-acid N-acetyltransferase [Kibdelosporangium phytohabitans]
MNRDKGVTGPAGFRAAGIAAGIKASGALDLTLVVNDGPGTAAAGVFTTNVVKAAPVLWSQQVLQQRSLKAVVLNSGGANACTGPEGFQDTHATAEKVAEGLGCGAIEVAVCSTGLIGERLPMGKVLSGVDTAVTALASDDQAGLHAATGVMTTDTRPKQSWKAHEQGWSIGGFVKGAGMLAPNLATMLSVITTDADLDKDTIDTALREATRMTFDRLDVDGGTSTNDTVLVLASGASGVRPSAGEFTALLTEVSADLVKQLQGDAEGVTKEIAITVTGAATEDEAVHIGRIVAEDNLVKTALFGSDPNWGRIAMALGRAKARIDPGQLSIIINGIRVMDKGTRGEDRENADLTGRDIDVVIDLAFGRGEATILTTDLSHAYVEENSAYSS